MAPEFDLKQFVVAKLARIAPEIKIEGIEARVSFRDQFEFDSVDFLNFILAIEDHLKLRIPEVDYPKLSSLNGCVAYLTPYLDRAAVG